MARLKLIRYGFLLAGILMVGANVSATQQQSPAPNVRVPSFRSSVDLVRVNAIVRDRRGRFVQNLTARDFEVLDNGELQRITDLQYEQPGVSVALLIDVSGSMENRLDAAREAATELLRGLHRAQDESAVFTFDTRLEEVQPFASGLQSLPAKLASVRPFGATSLHDAIAATARRLSDRPGLRRAVVVFTDGTDNWSEMTPTQAAEVASAIDVPVYIVGIVPFIDNPTSDLSALTAERTVVNGNLASLSTLTGGRSFNASTALDRAAAAQQIIEEMRHQYVIAFEAGTKQGWHSLVVRTRNKDYVVRARSGYNAGQSRPIS